MHNFPAPPPAGPPTLPPASVAPVPQVETRHALLVIAKAAVLAAIGGLVTAALVGFGLFNAMDPQCRPGDLLCGVGEALIALVAGLVVGLGVYVGIAIATVRAAIPRGQRSGPMVAALVSGPFAILLFFMIADLALDW